MQQNILKRAAGLLNRFADGIIDMAHPIREACQDLGSRKQDFIDFVTGFVSVTVLIFLYLIFTAITAPNADAQGLLPTSPLTATATTASEAPKPALASGYINPYVMGINTASLGTKAFFQAVERINKPDSTKKAVGVLGLGIAIQTGGAVLLTLTKKTRWGGYLTLMGGRTRNTLYSPLIEGHFKANPLALAGIGFQTSPNLFIGAVAGASAIQTIGVIDKGVKASGLKPSLLYGVQVVAQLRHVWVNANLINTQGIGVGLTYFF